MSRTKIGGTSLRLLMGVATAMAIGLVMARVYTLGGDTASHNIDTSGSEMTRTTSLDITGAVSGDFYVIDADSVANRAHWSTSLPLLVQASGSSFSTNVIAAPNINSTETLKVYPLVAGATSPSISLQGF